MSKLDFDVAILGGGPTGCALALLLSRYVNDPTRIVLLQSGHVSQYGYQPENDPRVLALNHGSQVLLESLNAWPTHSARIQTIHVSQKGRLGRTVIRHHDFDVPQLGCVASYARLHDCLLKAVQAKGVTICSGVSAQVTEQDDGGVNVTQDGRVIRAALAVYAGGHPDTPVQREYAQMALLTRAKVSLPRTGWAFERFTREGPLAVLPHPEALDHQSVVWCCAPERARALQALPLDALSEALTDTFGTRLGIFNVQGQSAIIPLRLNIRSKVVEGRCVAIGNAAQTLHPVAGQGLNLGLRDAAALAIALRDWLPNPHKAVTPALKGFEQLRQSDRQVTALLTDSMARTFTSGASALEHLAGLTLLGMDVAPSLRAPLARHLLQGLRR